jgi:primosomal protein N' (replication factor Y)
MIAEVAFDVPASRPFAYRVPEGWQPGCGQRVLAPLRAMAARVGLIVGLREGSGEGLKPLLRLLDPEPRLDERALALGRWIAAESLTGLGATCLALLPPPAPGAPRRGGRRSASRDASGGTPAPEANVTPPVAGGESPVRVVEHDAAPLGPGPAGPGGSTTLLVGSGRERRLLDAIAAGGAPALVVTSDVEAAARWAQRLARIDRTVRLDSGEADPARTRAWDDLARGRVRLAVGTRSALLAPLPAGALLALVDEHEAAHRPPGPPRIHSREVVLERTTRDGLVTLLTSATPSAEAWWRASRGEARVDLSPAGPWPAVSVTDARGIARREALTPALSRAIRETLAAGRRVLLAVARRTAALGCDECGVILRCPECRIALAYVPAGRALTCRLCGRSAPPPDTCAECRGRRLTPVGWSAERVEQAVLRRFPHARIVRYEPDATRGRKGEAQRAAALEAQVVIGTRGAFRIFGRASLGLVGFVAPDQVLGLPDFRAAERTFALLWAAAERVRPDGQVIVQSRNASHYAFDAVAAQDLETFYAAELKFRAELGYPPYRRLAIVTVRGANAAETSQRAEAVTGALRGSERVAVYPPTADRRGRACRVVVKGDAELPGLLATALDGADPGAALRARGMMDVEVDPVEWPS